LGDIEMSDGSESLELKFQLWGWIVFIGCSVLFVVSSIRNRDVLSLVASILFLVGCVIFMIPLATSMMRNHSDKRPE
jgi:uncharacterized membrane protein YtjA (UPF0391 family)